jgi:hypothetical protein
VTGIALPLLPFKRMIIYKNNYFMGQNVGFLRKQQERRTEAAEMTFLKGISNYIINQTIRDDLHIFDIFNDISEQQTSSMF